MKIVVEFDDMRRMQAFLKIAGAPAGSYRYTMRGSSGSFTAELELFPYCFGYGTTPEEAFTVMRRNLPMFINDGASATLVQV